MTSNHAVTGSSSFDAGVDRLLADVQECADRLGLVARVQSHDRSQIVLELSEMTQWVLKITVFSSKSSSRHFAAHEGLAFSYRQHPNLAPERLSECLNRLKETVLQERAVLTAVLTKNAVDWGKLRRMQLPELVRQGLKPAAIVNVKAGSDEENRVAQTAPSARGTQCYSESDAGKVTVGGHHRFVYLASDQTTAERLRDIDEALIFPPYAEGKQLRQLRIEQGSLLGFPECCITKYAAHHPKDGTRDEYYTAQDWLNWGKKPAHPTLNFIAARLFGLTFLQHIPCSRGCPKTMAASELALKHLECAITARAIRELMRLSFVLWPDGSFLPFQWEGEGWFKTKARHPGRIPFASALLLSHRNKWVGQQGDPSWRGEVSLRIHRGHLEINGKPVLHRGSQDGTPRIYRFAESTRA